MMTFIYLPLIDPIFLNLCDSSTVIEYETNLIIYK